MSSKYKGDPWCESPGPRDPVLVFFYWAIMFHWIINTVFGGYGCYQLFKPNGDKTAKSLRILYGFIVFFFFLNPPGWAFGIQAGWECWFPDVFQKWEGIYMIGIDGYFYGLVFCNIFFMVRLKYIFSSTAFENALFFWILFVIILIPMVTLPIAATILFLLGWVQKTRRWALWCCTVFNVTSIICNSFILVVFVSRMLSFSKAKRARKIKSQSQLSDEQIAKAMHQTLKVDQEFMNVIIRYCVTGFFIMMSTWVMIIYSIMFAEINQFTLDLRARGLYLYLSTLDGTVNLISLSLQFNFMTTVYDKGCGCMTKVFGRCIAKLLNIKSRVKNIRGNVEFSSKFEQSRTTNTVTGVTTANMSSPQSSVSMSPDSNNQVTMEIH